VKPTRCGQSLEEKKSDPGPERGSGGSKKKSKEEKNLKSPHSQRGKRKGEQLNARGSKRKIGENKKKGNANRQIIRSFPKREDPEDQQNGNKWDTKQREEVTKSTPVLNSQPKKKK